MTAIDICPQCDRPTEWVEERNLCSTTVRLTPALHVCHPDDLESASRLRYRLRLEQERSAGAAYVGTLLDQLCADFGLDPVEVWRRPHFDELTARRDRALLRAAIYYGHIVLDPSPYWTIGGTA